MTAYIVQDAIGQNYLPITKSWRLNERHYGALRGINKDLTRNFLARIKLPAGGEAFMRIRRCWHIPVVHGAITRTRRRLFRAVKVLPMRVSACCRIGVPNWRRG